MGSGRGQVSRRSLDCRSRCFMFALDSTRLLFFLLLICFIAVTGGLPLASLLTPRGTLWRVVCSSAIRPRVAHPVHIQLQQQVGVEGRVLKCSVRTVGGWVGFCG